MDISKIPSTVCQRLWDRGFPMVEAYHRFQMPNVREKYADLREKGGPQHKCAPLDKEALETVDGHGVVGALLKFSQDYLHAEIERYRRDKQKFEAFDAELRQVCARWINSGRMIALAFNPQRRIQDLAFPVPRDVVERGEYAWDKNEMVLEEQRFVDVRIALPEWLEEFSPAHGDDKQVGGHHLPELPERDSAPVGRQSRRAEILEAYEQLQSEGKVRPSTPVKTIAYMVRELVLHKTPGDERGLHDETVRRNIRKAQETQKTQN
jgi:hypothetical protein